MAKPIFIIQFPEESYNDHLLEQIKAMTKNLQNDYYVLGFFTDMVKEVKFQCFYDKDLTEANFEELKEYVKNMVKSSTVS